MSAGRLVGAVVAAGVIALLAAGRGEAQGTGIMGAAGASKAMLCSACHGAAGNSKSDTMPILAGMPAWYFKKAIEDYAAGRRPVPEMEPYAKMVKELGVDDFAAYFAAQQKQPAPGTLDPAAVERGRAASAPCVSCHGPAGKGDPARNVPDISGQPFGYLKHQALLFKVNLRNPNDPALKELKAVMRNIRENVLGDIAAYYSSLR
jgi:cytochrome c553